MIQCLIVDDEQHAIDVLKHFINQTPFLQLAGATTDPVEALGLLNTQQVDLVFLDIQMPELTGIQFLKVSGNTCKVILTTAYSEYALQGFEHDVIDYLLKPIPFERFLKAAHKAQSLMQFQAQGANPPAALPPQPEPVPALQPAPTYMFVKGESKNKFLKIDYSDILYVEGLKNYVSIHLPGQRLVTYQSLAELIGQLPQPPFYRVHRSYIISIDKVSIVDGNTVYIGNKAIGLGLTYRERFLDMIREKKEAK